MTDEGEETQTNTAASGSGRAARKPRPEIQLYRPGMLRKGDSTKSLTTNDERPPRPEKIEFSNNRRKSNDTDSGSVNSRHGSGSTTPDANVMNARFQQARRSGGGVQQDSGNYNSTQSLYDSRKPGGYVDYGPSRSGRGGGQRGGYHQQNYQRQPFERNYNNRRGGEYQQNERASMRSEGAITKRNPQFGGRRRNDSMNSTKSEMPQSGNDPLHIDTSYDSVSQCGASSAFSGMMSLEEMCQSLQSMGSFDWSQEVENDFMREEEEKKRAEELEKAKKEQEKGRQEEEEEVETSSQRGGRRNRLQESNGHQNGRYQQGYGGRGNRRYNRRADESDRESSFGGSIAEEDEEEELKSGERTPTSTRSSYVYNSRTQSRNNENGYRGGSGGGGRRNQEQGRERKSVPKERRGYRGEHDDREDSETKYEDLAHLTTGRLAGRISIVKREVSAENRVSPQREPVSPAVQQQPTKINRIRKNSAEAADDMSNREASSQRRQKEIENNEGRIIKEIGDKIAKLGPYVAKKRDVEAAKQIVELSTQLAQIYSDLIFPDIVYSFTSSLEQLLFRQAFYKPVEFLKTGANSASSNAKLIRASLQRLLLNGIEFYEKIISKYQTDFEFELDDVLTWKDGEPTDEELIWNFVEIPVGAAKIRTSTQKTAIKSLSRHLVSIGDLHRYKTLVDGSENYTNSRSYYLKSSLLWPTSGHPYNQLGVVAYYSTRVIDEIFYLSRALACSHSYEAAKDRMTQRLSAMRAKVAKYEPLLDQELGKFKEVIKQMEGTRELWVDQKTGQILKGSKRRADGVLASFQQQDDSKLHRRAVSYLIDTFGLLVTRIGMDHFESVSERAFGLLYASLTRKSTDFSAKQLLQITTLFLYAYQSLKGQKAPSQSHLNIIVSTVFTIFAIFLEIFIESKEIVKSGRQDVPNNALLVLPALNLVSNWIQGISGESVEIRTLKSSILKRLNLRKSLEIVLNELEVEKVEESEKTYPEFVYLASFFDVIEAHPSKFQRISGDLNSGRILNMVEACRILFERSGKDAEKDLEDLKIGDDQEEEERILTREDIIAMEREKSQVLLIVNPEYLVVDTNVFIDHLDLVSKILELKKYQIVVPTMVMTELSGLSLPSTSSEERRERDTRANAKIAYGWLKEQARLKNSFLSTLTTQGTKIGFVVATEDNAAARRDDKINDDLILESCTKFIESHPTQLPTSIINGEITCSSKNTIYRNLALLTEDRGLTIKAISHRLPCRHVQKFAEWAGI